MNRGRSSCMWCENMGKFNNKMLICVNRWMLQIINKNHDLRCNNTYSMNFFPIVQERARCSNIMIWVFQQHCIASHRLCEPNWHTLRFGRNSNSMACTRIRPSIWHRTFPRLFQPKWCMLPTICAWLAQHNVSVHCAVSVRHNLYEDLPISTKHWNSAARTQFQSIRVEPGYEWIQRGKPIPERTRII